MRWLSLLTGLLLIGLALSDIFLTVLHTQTESRMSAAFNGAVWRLLRGLSRLLPSRRHAILSWGIPLMIVGLILLWVATLTLGYALIYAPWIHSAAHFTVPDAPGGAFADALYFSGVTVGTLGYGDFLPTSAPFRILAVVEALSGLTFITLSITYLLTLYPSLHQKNTLAASLNEETDGRVDAVPMVARYVHTEHHEALADRIRELTQQLLSLAEAHRFHSVLYYSHPKQVELSLVRVLVTVRGLLATLQYGMYRDDAAPELRYWSDPRVLVLYDAWVLTLRTLAHSVHIGLEEEARDDDEVRDYLRAEYAELRAELAHRGLLPSAEGGAAEEFATFRVKGDNYINAYRKHACYGSEEISREIKPPRLF